MSENFLRSLLEHYDITLSDLSKRCLPRSFSSLKRPDGLADFETVIARIEKAISTHEKTVIYGDYDVDGLTATAIMKIALDRLGLCPGYFIPSRYVEGYGLNQERVKQFHEKGYSLIICVDNGVSAHESIELAYSFGMDVVVIDHHEIETLPSHAMVFHQTKSTFLSYNCSAASLCYFVATRLIRQDEPYFAVLAGLAVYSDVMPIVENNLTMVKLCLSYLRQYRYRNLVSLLKDPDKIIEYDDIPFSIVPILNAVGRVALDSLSTNHACRFLIEKDNMEIITRYRKDFMKLNEEKKEIVKNAKEETIYHLESEHSYVSVFDVRSGLSGLLANQIMKDKKKGVLLFMQDEKDSSLYVGSIRLPEGYDGLKFLTLAKKYLLHSGGHPLALGLTILKKDYFQVATLFSTYIEGQGNVSESKDAIEITLEDLSKENYDIYERFFPFGHGFETPEFALTLSKEKLIPFSSRKGMSARNNTHGKVVCFADPNILEMQSYESFTLKGTLNKETFKGVTTYTLIASTIKGNIS